MSNYTLATIDQRFIAEEIARTGGEELLNKASRSYVGLYDEKENWYIPLRANLNTKKPENACFLTPFLTNNPHFVRPGLDFEKALFVPSKLIVPIRNTLPKEQDLFILENQSKIKKKFEEYVGKYNPKLNQREYRYSTIALFPEGISKIKNEFEKKTLSSQKIKIYTNGDVKNSELLKQFLHQNKVPFIEGKIDELKQNFNEFPIVKYKHQQVMGFKPSEIKKLIKNYKRDEADININLNININRNNPKERSK